MITIGIYGIRDTTHGCAPTYTHDHGLAVMRGGRVVSVVPLERRTRVKHDNQLGRHLPALLAELALDDPVRFVSVNSFVGDGLQTDDGNLRIEPTAPVRIDAAPVPARVRWFPDGIQGRDVAGWALCHEFAHVASLLPFVGRFEPRSLLTHIDGGASDSACSFWWWDGAQARLLEASWDRLKIPVNLFNVNPLVRAMLGFQTHEHLSIPGKLMGYAGHGQASPTLLAWLSEHRFFIDGPEDPQAILAIVNARFDRRWDAFDAQDSLCRDIAATIQRYFEDSVCEVLFEWQRKTGAEHLYYAGGAALNIPTNARLEGSGIFRSVHVPPCTNDTGLALGGAAWIEFLEHREVAIHGPFLASLGEISAPPRVDALDEIVESLAAGQVLGLCTGAAEVGPRALGHRSILARPDSIELRRRVSEKIKRREWYRPVAPVLLDRVAREAFGVEVARSNLAPFMLGAFRLRPGWENRFAGVLHADGSLRAQIVRADDPEQILLATILDRLWHRHGIAGLINTSFNGPGEPIVHSASDAVASARTLGLDGVVIDGSLHRP